MGAKVSVGREKTCRLRGTNRRAARSELEELENRLNGAVNVLNPVSVHGWLVVDVPVSVASAAEGSHGSITAVFDPSRLAELKTPLGELFR